MGFDSPVSPRVYHRGDRLFRAGESFEHLYKVRSGAIKSYVISADGEAQVIGFHLPGDIIGFDAIESGRHMSEAEALDTSSVCAWPFRQLSRLCAVSPSVQSRLMQTMSAKMRHDEGLLLLLGQRSAEQRIGAFLLTLANAQAHRGMSSSALSLSMSRGDIGSYLALAVETVSRVLTRLQEAGMIAVERNQITMLDEEALHRLTGDLATVKIGQTQLH